MRIRWRPTAMIMALSIMLLAGVVHAIAAKTAGSGIQWVPYAEGKQRGVAENKKVFLVFNADWCRYCLKMEKETFQDPTVIAYVNRNFVPISVNSDKEQEIAEKYAIKGLPDMWFIAENGERIGNRPGYIPAKEMLKMLKFIGTDSYRSMSYQAFVEKEK